MKKLVLLMFCASCVANGDGSLGIDTQEVETTNYLQKWNGTALADSAASESGGTLAIAESMSIQTGTGAAALFSTFRGTNSDGDNIYIGGGGLSSVGGTPTSLGSYNVSLGIGAMNGNTTGNASVIIGAYADYTGTSVDGVVAIGWQAMMASTTSSDDVAIGAAAMADTTTGFDNVAIGRSAMQACTTGMRNVAIGSNALANLTVSEQNVAIGLNALEDFIGAGDNTFANTAIGYQALQSLVNATGNTAVGRDALILATNAYGTALGIGAGQTITTGDLNTIIGAGAGAGITTGRADTVVGPAVGLAATLSSNVILADGDGNVRFQSDSSNNVTNFGGAKNKGTLTLVAGTKTATVESGATCVCSDNTAKNAVSCPVSGTTVTANGTGTDVIAYICF